MFLSPKVIHLFKIRLKRMSESELNETLNKYENMLKNTSAKECSAYEISKSLYESVDALIRLNYEDLILRLTKAKEENEYLNSVNPELYEMYHLGECNYFYNGTINERLESSKKVNKLVKMVSDLEEEYPNLKHRIAVNTPETYKSMIEYYTISQRIRLIKKEMLSRTASGEKTN